MTMISLIINASLGEPGSRPEFHLWDLVTETGKGGKGRGEGEGRGREMHESRALE